MRLVVRHGFSRHGQPLERGDVIDCRLDEGQRLVDSGLAVPEGAPLDWGLQPTPWVFTWQPRA